MLSLFPVQIAAFRDGLASLMSVQELQMFTAEELAGVLSASTDLAEGMWAPRVVEQHIVCQHGYTAHSPQVQQLLQVMSELSPGDKRLFLQFITGSPRLPIGGFAALSPRLTIVKASTAPGTHQDEKLPTCSTCQVYLKLPPYTSMDILREKLLLAIHEGQEHFAMD